MKGKRGQGRIWKDNWGSCLGHVELERLLDQQVRCQVTSWMCRPGGQGRSQSTRFEGCWGRGDIYSHETRGERPGGVNGDTGKTESAVVPRGGLGGRREQVS